MIGFIALGRPTFDTEFAQAAADQAFDVAKSAPFAVRGSSTLAMDVEQVRQCSKEFQDIDALVVFQATFADSTLVAALAAETEAKLVLWATREERTGGRLRLNSFCGINLAGYFLARDGRSFSWVYRKPDEAEATKELLAAIESEMGRANPDDRAQRDPTDRRENRTIGVLGVRPDGFEPCDFDTVELRSRFGVEVDEVDLSAWFESATGSPSDVVAEARSKVESMKGLADVDQDALDSSLRLYTGVASLSAERGWDGVATRCWPECFTEYGGAACIGNSLTTSNGIPGCCEADVYGVLTALALSDQAGEPAFVADLVDLDRESNTAVFWHCGSAPQEMASPDHPLRAALHSNRQKPLLNEFPLSPGVVTVARVSQSRHQARLVLGVAEMLDEPLAYSGTAGVARLTRSVDQVVDTILGEGLEHHYGLVYGDHREAMVDYAEAHGLEIVEL